MMVVAVLAVAVDATNFITVSDASKEAFRTATLLKTLNLNALIIGEVGVGKKSLAKYILPDAPVMDASDFEELLVTLKDTKEVIILNLHKLPNSNILLDTIKKFDNRIIATSDGTFENSLFDEFFSLKFSVPPLSKRIEDVNVLIEKFAKESYSILGMDFNIKLGEFEPDLSKNAKSLKKQVMTMCLLEDIDDKEIMQLMQNYLYKRLGSNSDYKKFLYLYEVPLIKSGLKKYNSQLKLSDILGLNRNTLRKKIADNNQFL